MTAPTVDLALPSAAQLLGAAAPNPETAAAQVTGGDPGRVADIGARLQRAGSGLDEVHGQSTRTQRVLAGGFANDGSPVYDARTHRQSLPAGFPDAGTRLHDVGRRVSAVGVELGSAIDDVTAAQARMWTAVDGARRGFAAEVDAARGPGGLIPLERVPALVARRDAVAGHLQELVDGCGRQVSERVGRYEQVLRGCHQLLAELGLPRAAAGPQPASAAGTQLGSVLDPRLEGSGVRTPAAPRGPLAEVFPVPPPLPTDAGFPILAGGPSVQVNVPAPGLGSALQDGPGSGQGTAAQPGAIDRHASGQPGAVGGPISGGTPQVGSYPPTARPGEIRVRRGNDGTVNSYQVYGADGRPVKRVDVRGRAHGGIPTPHVQEYGRGTNPASGVEYVVKGSVRPARPDEVTGLT